MPSAGSAVASFRANVTGTYNVRIQPLVALMYVRLDSASAHKLQGSTSTRETFAAVKQALCHALTLDCALSVNCAIMHALQKKCTCEVSNASVCNIVRRCRCTCASQASTCQAHPSPSPSPPPLLALAPPSPTPSLPRLSPAARCSRRQVQLSKWMCHFATAGETPPRCRPPRCGLPACSLSHV